MTHIAPSRLTTKAAFKAAVAENPDAVFVDDPSLFNPVSGSVTHVLAVHGSFTVTNHPKRTWFAQVKPGKDGKPNVT